MNELYKQTLQSTHFYKKWQNKLLIREIQEKRKCINNLIAEIKELDSIVLGTFSVIDRACIRRYVSTVLSRFKKETLVTHKRKLNNLGITNSLSPCDPDSVVFNYSKHHISFRIKTLLAYGLDFCLPIYKIDFFKYFLTIESLVARIKY